jgi:hypothetical protein
MANRDLTALDEAALLKQTRPARPRRAADHGESLEDLLNMPYIDELARRALENPELLDLACDAITRWRAWLPRHPPPGWLAAARILDSGDRAAIDRLVRAMNAWSPLERSDLLRWWGRSSAAAAADLCARYGIVLEP